MPITSADEFLTGDPLFTQADALAFAHNARGRSELGALETALFRAYPTAFASYHKQVRHGRVKAGEVWIWHESKPKLVFMVVRESNVGATRLRYVQACAMRLARDYRLDGFRSLAIAPLGRSFEQAEINRVLRQWFNISRLPTLLYAAYLPGVHAEEPPL